MVVEWLLGLNRWVLFGFLGQFFFSMRFIIQWISSEKAKRSVIPVAFWYFSLLGGSVRCTYAIYKQDPVFIFRDRIRPARPVQSGSSFPHSHHASPVRSPGQPLPLLPRLV